ncbi:MAG: hypothetical protein WAS27_01090 [Candidatus Saccharimonadales bacterium]
MKRQPITLPDKLAPYVDDDLLDYNVDHYPFMNQHLTPGETEAAQRIRQKLLAIPLWHATKNLTYDFQSNGIFPSSDLPSSHRDNHCNLDRSLGLDEYTFIHWAPNRRGLYGKRLIRIDSEPIITAPDTIVSADDVPTHLAPFYFSRRKAYRDLKPSRQHRVDTYLSSLVRGQDWIEITARNALFSSLHRENPLQRLDAPGDLGEIKHLGAIAPEHITGEINSPDEEARELTTLARHGFVLPHTPNTSSVMATLNEWQDIMDIARS